jgi:glycosyltransferase involved in cell wall biosynthesis
MNQKICLLTNTHISYNPRLLKEADALQEADYDVRVVGINLDDSKWQLDQALMAGRTWKLALYDVRKTTLRGRIHWLRAGLRQRFYQRTARLGWAALEKAYSRHSPELARLAAREPAELFIAHNLQALPAAAWAAKRTKAKLGFDAEDFHRGELLDRPENSEILRQTRSVEERYIPRCTHLTAASDGIAEAYAKHIPVKRPLTVLNVFPLAERAGQTPAAQLASERQGTELSLYWYSQLIGEDRGLDDAFGAVALLRNRVKLNLRGAIRESYARRLGERLKALGIAGRVRILPPVPPQELVERATCHDVGLALEAGETENRRVAVSNKLCAYLLAGLAVAATDTPGQRGILAGIPEAGFVYAPGDARTLADHLWQWLDNPARLLAARAQARKAAESRFCWDIEKSKLVSAVAQALQY